MRALDRGDKSVPGAIHLLRKFLHRAPDDKVVAGMFKTIGLGLNFEDIGAPGFIKSYNGKPTLFGKSGEGFGEFTRGDGNEYLEMDVNMSAHFSFLAQRAMTWGIARCEKLDLAIGFVLEVKS